MKGEDNKKEPNKTNEDKKTTWVKKTSNSAGIGHHVGGLSGTIPGNMTPDRTPGGSIPKARGRFD